MTTPTGAERPHDPNAAPDPWAAAQAVGGFDNAPNPWAHEAAAPQAPEAPQQTPQQTPAPHPGAAPPAAGQGWGGPVQDPWAHAQQPSWADPQHQQRAWAGQQPHPSPQAGQGPHPAQPAQAPDPWAAAAEDQSHDTPHQLWGHQQNPATSRTPGQQPGWGNQPQPHGWPTQQPAWVQQHTADSTPGAHHVPDAGWADHQVPLDNGFVTTSEPSWASRDQERVQLIDNSDLDDRPHGGNGLLSKVTELVSGVSRRTLVIAGAGVLLVTGVAIFGPGGADLDQTDGPSHGQRLPTDTPAAELPAEGTAAGEGDGTQAAPEGATQIGPFALALPDDVGPWQQMGEDDLLGHADAQREAGVEVLSIDGYMGGNSAIVVQSFSPSSQMNLGGVDKNLADLTDMFGAATEVVEHDWAGSLPHRFVEHRWPDVGVVLLWVEKPDGGIATLVISGSPEEFASGSLIQAVASAAFTG